MYKQHRQPVVHDSYLVLNSHESDYDIWSKSQKHKQSSLYGPLRVVRLCVLSIIVPGLLLSIPLYMRYNVYIQQAYPVGMSDIRLLDNRISTTWCQRQVIWSNATFNAFLVPNQPEVRPAPERVSMTRHLVLEDDMKEYWGFYLLKGSVVTVSTCVRWPGASLTMIKGHRHLKQCAYIGDDSSEELDEIFEVEETNNTSADYDISNKPTEMKKIKDGVVLEHVDISSHHHPHHKSIHTNVVEEALKNNWKVDNKKGQNLHLIYAEKEINPPNKHRDKEEFKQNPNIVNLPVEEDTTEKRVKSSKEIYEDLLNQIRQLGVKGKDMLEKLNKNLTESGSNPETAMKTPQLLEVSSEITNHTESPVSGNKTSSPRKVRRRRTVPTIGKAAQLLNQHDEDRNTAAEELDLEGDGLADIHRRVNETTDNDQSNSEFWSSFSSSEERLLNCEGLLLNLPLTPNHVCEANSPENILARASSPNTVSYTVPSNGYYFFVFNSENEIQPNFLRIHFRLDRTTYNVSGAVAACRNQTGSCSLPLRFWSQDRVIIELPVEKNETLWNEEFLAVSTCEPRTAVYIICIVSMPLIIILFAFQ